MTNIENKNKKTIENILTLSVEIGIFISNKRNMEAKQNGESEE